MNISIRKLCNHAMVPLVVHDGDAGADLYSVEDVSIPPLSRCIVRTGIAIHIPDGMYGRICPRSGLALKFGIDVLAGIIDSGYRGEICVILLNTDKDKNFEVSSGDRIAQLIIHKYIRPVFVETQELDQTDRLEKGFGSSGIK